MTFFGGLERGGVYAESSTRLHHSRRVRRVSMKGFPRIHLQIISIRGRAGLSVSKNPANRPEVKLLRDGLQR
jgi:hypothetical protein